MKALLFDIDQTIQNKENDTSAEVWERFSRLKEKFALACITARPFPMCKNILSKISTNVYSVFDDGACLAREDGRDRTCEKFININSVARLIRNIIPLHHLRIGISTREAFFANEQYLEEINNWFGETGDFKLLTKIPEKMYSIWVRDATKEEILLLKRNISDNCRVLIEHQHNDTFSLFVYNRAASKIAGLRNFCLTNKIELGEIAFVGDGLLDSEIAKRVGISAAVGNAHPKMKRAADVQLTKSYSDGVLEFLEKLGI